MGCRRVALGGRTVAPAGGGSGGGAREAHLEMAKAGPGVVPCKTLVVAVGSRCHLRAGRAWGPNETGGMKDEARVLAGMTGPVVTSLTFVLCFSKANNPNTGGSGWL